MQRLRLPNNVLLSEVENLLRNGVNVTLKVKGNSMLPFIVGNRDSVVLFAARHLQKGDMVLARLGDSRYVLHRIIHIHENKVTLMGDGNLKGVEYCHKSNISGKVIKIVRNGRYIDTDSRMERYKGTLWELLRPVRRYMLAIYRRCRYDKAT